jgi:hypothetical protein
MKKSVKILLTVCTMASMLSCRKGEDDPLLSLRSRKARVAGEWKMTSGEKTYLDNNSDKVVYNGTTATSGNFSYDYTLKMTFKKDGSFSMEELDGKSLTSASGTWDFTSGIGELKNKEQIVMYISSMTLDNQTYQLTGKAATQIYNLKELRNKKMVLVEDDTLEVDGRTGGFLQQLTMEQ